MTRRTVLGTLAVTAAMGAVQNRSKIRLGGPVFGKHDDPRELGAGRTANWATPRRIARTRSSRTGADPRHRGSVQAGGRRDLRGRRVGRICSIPTGKSEKRIRLRRSRLALAEAVGAIGCVDIAGSYNPTVWYGPHPKNLSRGVLRRDRGELPQADRPGQAEAHEVLRPSADSLAVLSSKNCDERL